MAIELLSLYISIILVAAIGAGIGSLLGLVPGLHVNNIALIALSISGLLAIWLSQILPNGVEPFVAVAAFIIGVATAQTFVNTIPATFLGAPDEGSALTALPAHKMLLEGRGFEAVSLSAMGSMGAIIFCVLLSFPFRFILAKPLNLYGFLNSSMVVLLIAVSVFLIATEKGKILSGRLAENKTASLLAGVGFALFVFLLSGIFGLVIFKLDLNSPLGLEAPVLFPALAGLFGTSALVNSLMLRQQVPPQEMTENPITGKKEIAGNAKAAFAGTISGALISILPGVTSAAGTVIASNITNENEKRRIIVTLSAVNTANAFFVLVVLFLFLKTRSGVAIALNELVPIEAWSGKVPPEILTLLLAGTICASVVAYFMTRLLGRGFARVIDRLPYRTLLVASIAIMVMLVALFTGAKGILILLTGTAIGLIPITWGVRRSQCMGVLLVPIIYRLLV